jgi:N-acetylneuraminate synthase
MIKLGNHKIGVGYPPFIIAEMSGNHNQSLEKALAIVDSAAASGVHALKIQTYTPDTMTIDINEGEFHIKDPDSLWSGRSLYDLYGEAHTPWEWHQAIFDRARKLDLIPFSTPFDNSAVDFLESLDCAFYKIASFENTDLPLIRRVAATGKPMIISTGMMTIAEMDDTVKAAREAGCKDLVLLKCTSTYPSTPEGTNINTIPVMKKIFGCEVGLSDHTMGIGAAVASVALGATVIEKHFTLDRSSGGVDSTFSMEPAEMKALVIESERASKALGEVVFGPSEKEKNSLQFRRSLYIVKDMKAGDIITKENMRAIRPGMGLATKYIDVFLGKTASRDIARGTPVSWGLIT